MTTRPLVLALAALSTSLATAASAAAPEGLAANGEGCAAHLTAAAPQDVKIGNRAATSTGSRLTFKDAAPGGKLVLGVLGPINEDSGQNLFVLKRYLQFFKEQGVQVVVVSGDTGEVASGIQRALEAVADSGVPVLAVAGNRECGTDFKKGLERAQKTHANLVNMNVVRAVELKEATVVSLPGYHDPNFISCATGCRYDKGTLDEVVKAAKESKSPVILLSHGPPKGAGNKALDYAVNGGNVGDAEINKAIAAAGITFGIFSNIKEAGARATDLEGTALVPQDKPVKALFLNPGPADSTRWEMNDKTPGYGFAATLTINGKEASWKLYKSAKLTKEEKAEAHKMDPPKHRDEGEDSEGTP
ncbi:MAG TPA: metallophosphoesterase [Myxococcaceae bacterium]|nr:metallophosphoesterase [Myxococcaceae bacterium]